MYEKFTDRARKVMQLANQEAQRFNHEYIAPEHILLGLVKEGTGVAAQVLQSKNVELRKIRLEAEKLIQSGPEMITMGKLPQTTEAKKVIQVSIEEAQKLNHNYVGSEHILLALLSVEESLANDVLIMLGLQLDEVRDGVRKQLRREIDSGENLKAESGPTGIPKDKKLDRKAQNRSRKERLKKRRLRARKAKGKQADSSVDIDKICEQIYQLSSAQRMEVLQTLWEVGGGFSEQTPRLAIDVLGCERVDEIIEIEIEVTNVSLNPIVISGFAYHFPSLFGEGTCYCFCRPGESKELAFGIRGCDENEASVSLLGFNPQQGFPENDGAVIHGFVAKIE